MDENSNLKCFFRGSECLVIEAFDKSLFLTIDDEIYALQELKTHKLISKELDLLSKKLPKPKKKYILQ